MHAKELKNRILGSSLLIAGCCIGAGMLGIPVMSGIAGFFPSLVIFAASWLYMLITGFLLLEVNLSYPDSPNLVSMAERTLGKIGKYTALLVFAFLFYSILVAYVTASGEIFSDFLLEVFGISVSAWVGGIFVSVLLGLFIYFGTQVVDRFNRILMFGLAAAYLALIVLSVSYFRPSLLLHQEWKSAYLVIPAMIISFGYHNLIPSISTYLHKDRSALKKTIIYGTLIPFGVYLIWELIFLGIVPYEEVFQYSISEGDIATQALKKAVGSSNILIAAEYFGFFAIITSFLTVALSFVDFLADGLKIKQNYLGKFLLCLLVLMPPFIFAQIYPKIFLVALKYAGGVATVILFGILPALMVWSRRAALGNFKPILRGGKMLLLFIIAASLFIMSLQIL